MVKTPYPESINKTSVWNEAVKAARKELIDWLLEYNKHGNRVPLEDVIQDLRVHSIFWDAFPKVDNPGFDHNVENEG